LAGLRIQRHPCVGRPRNVPDAAARSGAVPVKHGDRTVTVEERVVRRPIVVTDDLLRAGRDDAPSSVGRWGESGKRVVITPQQFGSSDEGDFVLVDPARHRLGPPLVYVTLDELQDGAALLVHPHRFGSRTEAHAVKVLEERMYRGCPGPGSSAYGVAHFDSGTQIAAEGLFLHTHILLAFSAAATYLLAVRVREAESGPARWARAWGALLLATDRASSRPHTLGSAGCASGSARIAPRRRRRRADERSRPIAASTSIWPRAPRLPQSGRAADCRPPSPR
jgi:hypothetical protein